MQINGWDISQAGAKQWNVTFGNHTISNSSDWVRGSPGPVLCKNDIDFKSLKVVLLVYGSGREQILLRCSEILSHLLEPADLKLDRYTNRYYGILTKYSTEESSMKRFHKLTLEFECYEYGAEVSVSFSGTTQMTVTNTGNIETPAIIEITPQIGAASITLTGLCRDYDTGEDLPVIIRDLLTNKVVVIDGESGMMTQGGDLKAGDIDIWALPTLLPGSNTITIDSNRMDITVRFHPRFM